MADMKFTEEATFVVALLFSIRIDYQDMMAYVMAWFRQATVPLRYR